MDKIDERVGFAVPATCAWSSGCAGCVEAGQQRQFFPGERLVAGVLQNTSTERVPAQGDHHGMYGSSWRWTSRRRLPSVAVGTSLAGPSVRWGPDRATSGSKCQSMCWEIRSWALRPRGPMHAANNTNRESVLINNPSTGYQQASQENTIFDPWSWGHIANVRPSG